MFRRRPHVKRSIRFSLATGFIALSVLLTVSSAAEKPKKSAESIDEFVVGRLTAFDSDPKGIYDVFVVRAAGGLSSVERIRFRPLAGSCPNSSEAEVAIGAAPGTILQLLEKRDLCSLSEKQKHKAKKASYIGSQISLGATCGGARRLLHYDTSDADFQKDINAPNDAMWIMRLMDQLNQATEALPAGDAQPMRMSPAIAERLSAGEFDDLFEGSPERLSEMYRDSLQPNTEPTVSIRFDRSPVGAEPIAYPALAKAARVEGLVVLHLKIEKDGRVTIRFLQGHPMLRATVEQAAREWKFPPNEAGHEIRGGVEFKLNCSVE